MNHRNSTEAHINGLAAAIERAGRHRCSVRRQPGGDPSLPFQLVSAPVTLAGLEQLLDKLDGARPTDSGADGNGTSSPDATAAGDRARTLAQLEGEISRRLRALDYEALTPARFAAILEALAAAARELTELRMERPREPSNPAHHGLEAAPPFLR